MAVLQDRQQRGLTLIYISTILYTPCFTALHGHLVTCDGHVELCGARFTAGVHAFQCRLVRTAWQVVPCVTWHACIHPSQSLYTTGDIHLLRSAVNDHWCASMMLGSTQSGASCGHHVQAPCLPTQEGPNPTGGLEPQPGWMALCPESRFLLTLVQAAVGLAWPVGLTTACQLLLHAADCMHACFCLGYYLAASG